jgi:arylsulfatase A-like enzyme
MNYFESSIRVPLLVYHPREFQPHRVKENVSTIDILPTMCDLVGIKPFAGLPMDGLSLLPHLQGTGGHDKVYGEYTGEGTISPLMMIKEGPWKYIYCPSDGMQLFNLDKDPLELVNLARRKAEVDEEIMSKLHAFENECKELWNFDKITKDVLHSQRKRRLVWSALTKGKFTNWDFNPADDGTTKYERLFD